MSLPQDVADIGFVINSPSLPQDIITVIQELYNAKLREENAGINFWYTLHQKTKEKDPELRTTFEGFCEGHAYTNALLTQLSYK